MQGNVFCETSTVHTPLISNVGINVSGEELVAEDAITEVVPEDVVSDGKSVVVDDDWAKESNFISWALEMTSLEKEDSAVFWKPLLSCVQVIDSAASAGQSSFVTMLPLFQSDVASKVPSIQPSLNQEC